MGLEELTVTIGGFVGILASNRASVTLPPLEFLVLSEHMANGTNRLSVVTLGLIGTSHFAREGLIDCRKGTWMAVLIALDAMVGWHVDVDLSDAILDVM